MFACVGALAALMSHRSITQGSNVDTPFAEPARETRPLDDVAFTSAYVNVPPRVARVQAPTPVGDKVRHILKTARLEAAIDLADVANPGIDRTAALVELDAIAKNPSDASAGIAGILGATLAKLQGRDADARARMTTALTRWAVASARVRTDPPSGSLEADVLAVRDVVGAEWNADSSSVAERPFVIAPAELRVQMIGRDAGIHLDVSRQLPGATKAVFMTDDEMAYLTRAVSRIGGTNRRQPAFMEVPNKPIGDARTIIQWWNEFFRAYPGHWKGFDIMTSPSFTSIKFTNTERTRAIIPVRTGYSGHDVMLERLKGVWTVRGSDKHWIE